MILYHHQDCSLLPRSTCHPGRQTRTPAVPSDSARVEVAARTRRPGCVAVEGSTDLAGCRAGKEQEERVVGRRGEIQPVAELFAAS